MTTVQTEEKPKPIADQDVAMGRVASQDEPIPEVQGPGLPRADGVTSIADFSQELISLVDRDYVYRTVNQAYCQAVGRPRDEIVGRTVADIWGEKVFREVIKPQLDRCLAGQEVHEQNWIEYAAWGWRCMDLGYYPYHGDGTEITHAVIVARDITKWVQAESQRSATLADLELSHSDLAGRVAELETLHQVSMALSSTLELQSLLRLIVEKAAMLVDAADCSILLLDEKTGDLIFQATVGKHLEGVHVPAGHGIAARTLALGIPQIVHDVTADPDHYPTIGQESGLPTRSVLAVPMLVEGKPVGVLEAVNKRRGRFTERDRDLLMTLANHAAIAIENARLFEKAQREIAERQQAERELRAYKDHLEELVAARTAELTQINEKLRREIARRKQVEASLRESEAQYRLLAENMSDNIWTLDLATLTFTYISPAIERLSGFAPQEIIGQTVDKVLPPHSVEKVNRIIARSLERVTQGDADPTNSVKLEVEQYHKDGHTIWVEIQARFLYDEEGNPTTILGVSRDVTARKWMDAALNRLLDLSRELGGIRDLEAALRRSINAALEIVTNAEMAALQWLQEDGETLRTVVTSGDERIKEDPISFQAGVGIAGHAFQERRTINVPDVLADDRFVPGAQPLRFRSLLVTPLLTGDEVLGTLSLASKRPGAFSSADETLVGLLADQVASALENARYLTARRLAEAERAAAFELLQTTIDAIQDPILLIGNDYQVRLANKAVYDHYPEDELLYCYQVSHRRETPCDGKEHPCPLQEVRKTLKPVTVVHEHILADEEKRLFEIIASPLLGEGGELIGIVEATRDITERVRAEATLREREAQLAQAQHLANLGSWGWDIASESLTWSDELYRIYGLDPKKHVPAVDSFGEHIHPDDLPLVTQALQDIMTKGEPVDYVHRIVRPDGTVRTLHARGQLIVDDDGTPVRLFGTAHDITEQVEAEAALRESEERYRLLVEHAPLGILSVDPQGRIVNVNEAMLRILGSPSAEATKSINVLTYPPLIEAGIADDIRRCLVSGEVVISERPYTSKWGKSVHLRLHLTPIADKEGKIHLVQIIAEDITKRKKAEAELRKLTQAVEQSANVVVITDVEGNIEYVNPKFVRVTGYTEEEAIGQNPRILKSGEHSEEFYRNLWQTITAGREWRGEFHNKRKDGSLYWERASIAPVYDDEGRITHFIAVKEDITAQKEAEEALHRYTERVLALYEISQDILHARSPEAIAKAALRRLRNLLPCRMAGVLEFRPSDSTARMLASYSEGASRLGTGFLFPLHAFDTERLETGHPWLIRDTAALSDWPQLSQILYKQGIRSFLVVPLIVQGQLLGVLGAGSASSDAFTEEHVEVAIQAASMLAVAIQQARLYEQTQRDAVTKADLLKEVNHRVKNNLMAIGGLLLAEQRYAPAESRDAVRTAMQRLLQRIEGLAQVHTMLSASQWSPLPLSEMTSRLIHTALNALPPDRQVEVDISPSPVEVSPRQASNLALIINELVTNSIKYAVQPSRPTRIAVHIAQEGDEIVFEYRDNGPGYPEDVLRLERHDVGMYLIQRTVQLTLNGTLNLHNDGGAVTTIRFKVEERTTT